MKKAIFRRFFLVIVIALVICSGVSCAIISNKFYNTKVQDMLYTLRLLNYNMDFTQDLQNQIEQLNPITMTPNTRITIVDMNGYVCADSAMNADDISENHLQREEITQAVVSGFGSAERYSETIKVRMLYAAIKSDKSDYIIRLSIPFEGLLEDVLLLVPAAIISSLAAMLISAFLAKKFSETITEPLDEISNELLKVDDEIQDFRFSEYRYDELNQIVVSTVKFSDRIQKTMDKLRMERNKIDYILSNMTEGILILDENQNVLTINYVAKIMLACSEVEQGRNLTRYTQIPEVLEACEKAQGARKTFTFDVQINDEKICEVHVAAVQKAVFSKTGAGVVILLVDVTNDRNAQVMRQDFFSNVSHELKTPITSIQGFAELLESGMVSDEKTTKEFLVRIKKETKNMTNLINDILMISKLESRQHEVAFAQIRIKPMLEDIAFSFEPMAKLGKIAITTDCEDVTYTANAQQIHQLINNLVVNAVKYNVENGNVKITVRSSENELVFTVEDSGIGIPKISQGRIFERFYRVDKGRSRKMGGTGLGLSIVKHIVQFYNGKIELESKVDVGTKITIRLPIINR